MAIFVTLNHFFLLLLLWFRASYLSCHLLSLKCHLPQLLSRRSQRWATLYSCIAERCWLLAGCWTTAPNRADAVGRLVGWWLELYVNVQIGSFSQSCFDGGKRCYQTAIGGTVMGLRSGGSARGPFSSERLQENSKLLSPKHNSLRDNPRDKLYSSGWVDGGCWMVVWRRQLWYNAFQFTCSIMAKDDNGNNNSGT